MLLRTIALVPLLLVAAANTIAEEARPADAVMASAFSKAKAEKKTVFLSFHASWCGWCHKLEDFLKQPEIKQIWDKRFVTVWLTVLESKDKKADENPGGDVWLKKLGGENEGIPFIALFDGQGTLKAESRVNGKKGGNIGYPAKAEEIAWFMDMLKRGAPNVTASERAVIQKALEDAGKKLGG